MVMTAERQMQWDLGEVHVDRLPALWPQILPLLDKGCEHSNGHFTPKSIIDGMFAGTYRLIGMQAGDVITSVMVVAVTQAPAGGLIFDCLVVGGEDMRAWLPFESEMDAFARSFGCDRVRMIGRKGIAKMLPHWKLTAIVLEREL